MHSVKGSSSDTTLQHHERVSPPEDFSSSPPSGFLDPICAPTMTMLQRISLLTGKDSSSDENNYSMNQKNTSPAFSLTDSSEFPKGNLFTSLYRGGSIDSLYASGSGSDLPRSESVISLSDSETDYVPYQPKRLQTRRGSAPPDLLKAMKAVKFPMARSHIIEEDEDSNGEAKYCDPFPSRMIMDLKNTRRGSLPATYFSQRNKSSSETATNISKEHGSKPLSQPFSSIAESIYVHDEHAELPRSSSTQDITEAYKRVNLDETGAHNSSKVNMISMLGVTGYGKTDTGQRRRSWLSSIFAPQVTTTVTERAPIENSQPTVSAPIKKTVRKRDINCFAPNSM